MGIRRGGSAPFKSESTICTVVSVCSIICSILCSTIENPMRQSRSTASLEEGNACQLQAMSKTNSWPLRRSSSSHRGMDVWQLKSSMADCVSSAGSYSHRELQETCGTEHVRRRIWLLGVVTVGCVVLVSCLRQDKWATQSSMALKTMPPLKSERLLSERSLGYVKSPLSKMAAASVAHLFAVICHDRDATCTDWT